MPSALLPQDHRLFVELFMLALLILAVVVCEWMAPGTKVEESFNMQAVHDVLFSPTLDAYDHLKFTGVVPRTFTGAVVLAGLVSPLASFFPKHGQDALIIAHTVRCVLGLLFAWSCWYVGQCLNDVAPQPMGWRVSSSAMRCMEKNRCGKEDHTSSCSSSSSDSDDDDGKETEGERQRVLRMASRPTFSFPVLTPCAWFLLSIGGVFHIVYYATRTLPNTFALILLNVALGLLLQPTRQYEGLAVVGVTATVFRGDMFALAAPLGLALALSRRVHLGRGLLVGLASVGGALIVTVPLDSFLWRKPLCSFWPEGVVLLFNTVENQSHLWGTQPWHWYFSYALPRCFLGVLPLVLWSVVRVGPIRHLSLSAVAFIALYSALPHKEVRFVMVVFPWLLAPLAVWLSRNGRPAPPAAQANVASGVDRALRHGQRTTREHVRAASMVAYLLLHVAATLSSAWISSFNYPGSVALVEAHRHIDDNHNHNGLSPSPTGPKQLPPVAAIVQLDAYAAMTGISRFAKRHYRPSALASLVMRPPSRRNSGRNASSEDTNVVVGYNKNPFWFNLTHMHTTAAAAGGHGVDFAEGEEEQRYHTGFSVIVRRSDEAFLHTRKRVYVQQRTIDAMDRFQLRTLQISTTPFLTVWTRPRWKQHHQQPQQQQHE